MSRMSDPESEATERIYWTLRELDPAARGRVLRWAADQFDVTEFSRTFNDVVNGKGAPLAQRDLGGLDDAVPVAAVGGLGGEVAGSSSLPVPGSRFGRIDAEMGAPVKRAVRYLG